MTTYLLRHMQVLFDTLGRMARTPLPTSLTITILGIAIALPVILFKFSDSMAKLAGSWEETREITLFIKIPDHAEEPVTADFLDAYVIEIGQRLLEKPRIRDVEYISRESGLEEFRNSSGFETVFDDLPVNPLPPMLVVYPEQELSNSDIKTIAEQLESMGEVDSVVYDHQWRERLDAIVSLVSSGVGILTLLMCLGVILVIGNIVRTGILNRSDEIEIIDQIGGTHAFIRRPFLYYGVLHSVFGGIVALVLSVVTLSILNRPVQNLARLYDSDFSIGATDPIAVCVVISGSALLGWVAARITVGAYLRKLRPSGREK